MKIKRYTTIFSLLFVLFSLTSCRELWDFVVPPEFTGQTVLMEPAPPATSDPTMSGVLIGERHLETLGETYIPMELGGLVSWYCRTLYLPGMTLDTAVSTLDSLPLTYTVEEKLHPSAAGTVYAVEYAGGTLDGAHYINPAVPMTLYVSAPKPEYPASTVENTVYITFDDGPTATGTAEILDILDTYGIKGTFFLVGREMEKAPEAAKLIYDRGHDVACHSMSHNYDYIYASAENLMEEVDAWVAFMEGLGVDFTTTAKLFRYPGGSTNPRITGGKRQAMDELLAERGFVSYDWNIVSNDALLFQCPPGMTTYDYIRETFRDTFLAVKGNDSPKILLLHETVAETRVVLPWIIEYLISEGCTFAPLSALSAEVSSPAQQ